MNSLARLLSTKCIAGSVLVASTYAGAQEDVADLRAQIERERLLLMEQMQQLQAQVGRLDEMERRLDTSIEPTTSASATVPMAGTAGEKAVDASTADRSVSELLADGGGRERIDPLRNNPVDLTGALLAAEPFENSWPLYGTGARMAIGGYVKLDYVQDFDGADDRFQFPVSGIPVPGDGRPEQSGYMNFFSRESRINFDVRQIMPNGTPLQVFLEMDFWNLDDTPFFSTPRLRHFYGVYGPLLAGRTWGTLTDVYSLATTIDFAAGDAVAGSRRPQIRWEQPLGNDYNWAVALEMLEFPEIDNVFNLPGEASQELPALAARVTKQTERGRVMLGASAYQLRWDGQGEISNATELGWGIVFSGRKALGERDFLVWNASMGEGWGSNVVSGIGGGTGAILKPDGTLEPLFSWNLQLGGAHYLSETLALNASLAWASFDDSDLRPDTRLLEGGAAHLNMIWSPFESVNVGVEYMVGLRRNVDGADGTAQRLQAMIKFTY